MDYKMITFLVSDDLIYLFQLMLGRNPTYLFSLIYKIEKSQVDPNFLYRSRSFQILRNENV